MELTVTQDLLKLEQIYTLVIPYSEWVAAEISETDRLLFVDCDKSGKLSDKLLGLATLVKRIEEIQPLPTN